MLILRHMWLWNVINKSVGFHTNLKIAFHLCNQVIAGGNYDVDMELLSPSGSVLYKETKQQYDSYTWTTDTRGEYKFCFSNEFSTFTHKQVYFNLQVGDAKQVDKALEIQHVNTMTQVKCIDADSKWNKLMLGWTVTESLVLFHLNSSRRQQSTCTIRWKPSPTIRHINDCGRHRGAYLQKLLVSVYNGGHLASQWLLW